MEAILQGLTSFAQPASLLFLVIGVLVGSLVGLVPGLNGLTAIALLLPFVYGMDAAVGLSFLLAMHAVVNTAGAITAILLGIPGEPACTATVVDGYPMAQQGRGGEAIGAALAASAIGGVFGALVLMALLPILAPVMLYFKSPDTLMVAVFGVSLIAILSQGNMAKGLFAGALGMLVAMFGYQQESGVPRFWFGLDYLLDGFQIIPVTLGLFAVPEIISMGATGREIASKDSARVDFGQVMGGVGAAFRHWWLVIRSSALGVVIGIIPGMGGATAPWLAYAMAAQSSKTPERFGKGAVEGVMAPEASNNSKEGGAMVPTLAFGIPGSSSMAILIGAFFLFGLTPGPEFLKSNMPVAVHLTVTIAVANLLAAVLAIGMAAKLTTITRVPGRVLAPILMVTLVVGTYATSNEIWDVLFLLMFGAVGLFMKELNISRPAFLLGFVLAPMVETYLHISLAAHGWGFLLRPIPLAVMVGLAIIASRPLWRKSRRVAA
jgi:putative tricarboxylic transport membrane protein